VTDIKSFVERIENLETEKDQLTEDIRSVYSEAKAADFNIKALKMLVAKRRRDQDELAALEAVIAEYEAALGPLATTPLGKAAVPKRAVSDFPDLPESLRRTM
jgi:uncharacterized protein (UPF0335 family)